jgi:hypothetical protein
MLPAIWGVSGFHLLDLMPEECRFDAQYFVEHVVVLLVQTGLPTREDLVSSSTQYSSGQLPCSVLKNN